MNNKETYQFEYQFFRGLLGASILFFLYRIGEAFYLNYYPIIRVDFAILGFSILVLSLLRFDNLFNWLRVLYCLFLISSFVFYWYAYGGLHGPVTYMYFALITVFIALLPNKLRELFALVLGIVAIGLALDAERSFLFAIRPLNERLNELLPFYYLFSVVVIAAFVGIVKRNFDKETRSLETSNTSLDQVNGELQYKFNDLLVQKEEIKSIQENLELFVSERTLVLNNRNQKLEQYAYNNAHFVRKHLSNIMGLLDVLELEKEENNINPADLQEIRNNTEELDQLIRQVNTILK